LPTRGVGDARITLGYASINVGFWEVAAVEIAEHIAAITREANRLAEAAHLGGLDAPVPTCPGWDLRDLVRHLGMVHLWAASHVAQPHDEPDYESEADELTALTGFWPNLGSFWPDDGHLIDWYLRTKTNLVDSLESAPPNVEAWTFLPAPSPLAMWARRQAHETAIHRFDAESAADITSSFDPALASDGIDEMLSGFATRRTGDFPVATTQAMIVHATDTDERWHVTLAPNGITTVRNDGPADITLAADASDLYLTVWNRGDDSNVKVTGNHELLDTWHENLRVRWS
jgi:uncharacterized protein (TIGR03083 family)